MIYAIKMQLAGMMRKKVVVITYFIVFGFVLVNFYHNVMSYKEVKYISEMFDPFKVLTLSCWSKSGYFLMEYFPILVVIATACSYLTDKDTRVKIYIQARVGNEKYWYSKIISVFIMTFLIFTVPFLIEILLNSICFNINSLGDPSNFNYITTIETENEYVLADLWIQNRILYVVFFTLVFGLVSAVLATFNFAITTLPIFKFKIFTFFPIYILIYVITLAGVYLNPKYSVDHFMILRMFNKSVVNWGVYSIFLVCLMIISIGLIVYKIRKDDVL